MITLAIYLVPSLVRFVRVTAIEVLGEGYVDTARAKGVRPAAILLRHVAPNTLITTITYIGLQLGVLISGAIVVEVIFSIPGIGRLGMNAAGGADRHDIDSRIGQHVIELVINLAADFGPELISRRRERIETSGHFRTANVGNGLGMKAGDHATANNSKTGRHARSAPDDVLALSVIS